MPRTCTVCQHPERAAIDRALVQHAPYRGIAQQHRLSPWALFRHREEHVPAQLAQAEQARETAEATDLLAEVTALRGKAVSLLLQAEQDGDYRAALAGIREARACLELLGELQGQLARQPTVNVLISAEWLAVRTVLLTALGPYPDARAAVAARLRTLEHPNEHTG